MVKLATLEEIPGIWNTTKTDKAKLFVKRHHDFMFPIPEEDDVPTSEPIPYHEELDYKDYKQEDKNYTLDFVVQCEHVTVVASRRKLYEIIAKKYKPREKDAKRANEAYNRIITAKIKTHVDQLVKNGIIKPER